MTWQRRTALWSSLVLLGWPASSVPGQVTEATRPGIDAVTVTAYEKLGGTYNGLYGVGYNNVTMVGWSSYRAIGAKDLPGFSFRTFPKGPLPVVGVPFSLDFSQCQVTDAGLKELASLKKLRSLCL